MNWLRTFTIVLAAATSLGAMPGARADEATAENKTLAPYFFIDGGDPAVDRLPLKATEVDAKIAGIIADVKVTQHYKNEGTRPIEARYVFPASTRAAVYGMRMRVGKRLVEARIREKGQARADYEAAKKEGRSASLLEQQRPNVFQMNVANIMPGDEISVELDYTETLPPTEGQYQFVFPTVVGPRYTGGSGTPERWTAQPTTQAGKAPTATFGARLTIDAPIPVKGVSSVSHKVRIVNTEGRHVEVVLDPAAANGNRDFIVDYALAGKDIESGVMLERGKDENFFLALVEPPKRVIGADIVPREYVFILDVSGSMHGYPMETAKALLRELVGRLRPSDTFNLMLFAGDNSVLAPASLPATPENAERAIGVINRQSGGGSTELLPALRRAFSLPQEATRARSFVVITDGYVTIEKEAFELVRTNLGNANVFSFGIGSSVNRHLMEGLARVGRGEAFIVTDSDHAAAEASRFRRYIESPVWTHLKLAIDGLDAYDIQPANPPDLFASRPIVLTGKWRGTPKGRITLEGTTGQGPQVRSVAIPQDREHSGQALRYLWARERIAQLADTARLDGAEKQDTVRAITELGLKYNLLTDYTSFVAVDQEIRNHDGSQTVDQPQPMPQGVSNLAVGGEVPSTPEPEFYALAAMAAGMTAWLRRRRNNRER